MARLLYISQAYTTHDRRFLEAMAQSGHTTWFLPCVPGGGEQRPTPASIHQLSPLFARAGDDRPWRWLRALVRLRAWVRKIRPELVHAGPVQTGGFLAAALNVRPLMVMSWGSDVLVAPDQGRWLSWVTRFTLGRADAVLGDCQTVRDRVLELGALAPEQVVWFPWGIDLDAFQPKPATLGLRAARGWESCQVIISTRAFEPIHGTLVFLEAVRQVMAQRDDVRVLMLGDGTLRPAVERFLLAHDLRARVHLAGQIPHERLPDYFNEADLYVSATSSDGSSISLLEAMGCGLPVVVTDGYGNREWVTHGRHGWLYPANDARALASTVLEALRGDRMRAQMAAANRGAVQQRADWTRNVQQLFAAYDRLLPVAG